MLERERARPENSDGFFRFGDHCHPESRRSTSTANFDIYKTRFCQQRCQRAAAPQFYVATVPERVGVKIPMIEK